MLDKQYIEKMLRAVLQSSKEGVSICRLQSDYKELCGENIPLKQLGFSDLEGYLRSIPSVVRLENWMGQLTCFAAVCRETAHIAELVARQRNSKKAGRSKLVNCKMRAKPFNTFMLNVKPRSSLRQPSSQAAWGVPMHRPRPHGGYGGFSASGDYRQCDPRLCTVTPLQHRPPTDTAMYPIIHPHRSVSHLVNYQKPSAPSSTVKLSEKASRSSKAQSGPYDRDLFRQRLLQLLKKHCSGVWISKLPEFYKRMFNHAVHPQALIDLREWRDICLVEQPSTTGADRLVYPPLPSKPTTANQDNRTNNTSSAASGTVTTHTPDRPSSVVSSSRVPTPPGSAKSLLAKPTFIFPQQTVVNSQGRPSSPVGPPVAPLPSSVPLPNFSFVCNGKPNLSIDCNAPAKLKQSPNNGWKSHHHSPAAHSNDRPSNHSPPPPSSSASGVPDDIRQKLMELLSKYSSGLWTHTLPKLFMDTYKIPFPENILSNVSLLLEVCTVEYPKPNDKTKAILYDRVAEGESTDSQPRGQGRNCSSGIDVLGAVTPPYLVPPSEQYPSVLITEAKGGSAVTVRYVGDNYSNAQEAMEDAMQAFYSQSSAQHLSKPAIGQLVAVRGEEGEELARAQVMEVVASNNSKAKVYYVDYGFSMETSGTNLLQLHQDFLSLPFQATNVILAGLEWFSSNPLVLSALDSLAVGKILLMETLELCQQSESRVVVLYDTSQDNDVNINVSCLKALQDKTMDNPLTVNTIYQPVCVTNVCADGTIYCQLPSRGTVKLTTLLQRIEAFFINQMTSESLVSRPFSGKFCLAPYKGKWARVEITSLFGSRVMEVLFIDFGATATIEVTELREIPASSVNDFYVVPPQAVRCRLAELTGPEGDWNPKIILWLKETVLGSVDCKIKISKVEQEKKDRLVYMYLFVSESQELDKSINHQLGHSELWQQLRAQNNLCISNNSLDAGSHSTLVEKTSLSGQVPSPSGRASPQHGAAVKATSAQEQQLLMPPLLYLPQACGERLVWHPNQNIDVFVPAACHPGYFVLQPWHDLHQLLVLMGEMMLFYNKMSDITPATPIQKGEVCAAKIDKNWHRVLVKGILASGLVSVYELDHGKHELVRCTHLRPLMEEFRQLPFQAVTARLAGVKEQQWSEEASMVFRNHVEKKALVAHVESVQEGPGYRGEPWACRLTVYLVDTTVEDRDLWIHNIMANMGSDLLSAAWDSAPHRMDSQPAKSD
ncbi:tudor domain-containing protein 7A isoform X2 [Genypterus blacodes]|uniref:tudor domain-containing protein 7A isoform X2 n=1 Tax=Genypterus blacodes TaxID=154954 RepID=UPI003F765520